MRNLVDKQSQLYKQSSPTPSKHQQGSHTSEALKVAMDSSYSDLSHYSEDNVEQNSDSDFEEYWFQGSL